MVFHALTFARPRRRCRKPRLNVCQVPREVSKTEAESRCFPTTERFFFFYFYISLGIEINHLLLKYRNLRKYPLLHYYFKSLVVHHFVATIYSFEFLVKMSLEFGINFVSFWSKYPFQNKECSLFKYYFLPFYKILLIAAIIFSFVIYLLIYFFCP